ncbi:hypothetical protein L1S35_00440 [Flavobacterium sp. AS60]|uniref:hypothetical protein n=1 Tax=Flavobacterium anseongense TaxID=2910677 RepID=UPI001F3DCC20|nr:hypothetical protein [Flavobacterium sp. AS60]MCF6128126.1 hypothetical protein [Flavobacterium sp. AS60]
MKKVFLFLILIPFLSFAKFYKGTVNYNDGTTKKGFIELPDNPTEQKLKFRSEENGKTEKLSIDEIAGFDIVNNQDITINFISIYLASGRLFSGKNYKIDSKKSWVRVEKVGKKIDLVSAYYTSSAVLGAAGQTSSSGRMLYLRRHENNFALILIPINEYGLGVDVNYYSTVMKILGYHFEDDCPKVLPLITKERLKNEGLGVIVDLFDENCGAK